MNRKENEAVVNRFLLSTLYFILGLCGIFILYRISSSPKFVMNFKAIVYVLIVLSAISVGNAIYKKNRYYAVMFSCIIVCLVIILAYFPIIAKIYNFFVSSNLTFFFNSYASYAICAGIMLLVYIYELVNYFLNVRK